MTAALLAFAAIVAGRVMFSRNRVRSTLVVPEKSIAVLPFENLSRDPDSAYFADGVQEEILTRLASIADLKSDFAHVHPAVSEQTWESLRDREAAWRSEHS